VLSAIAKITRPAPGLALARPRLHERLDEAAADRALTWIGAAAGSGKTVLAASWLEARKRPCLWYQLDARDADPAVFFEFLREAAARHAPRKRASLPPRTSDGRRDVQAYARSFFEQLSGWLRPGTIIVLDDFQELPEDSPLQHALPGALSAVPASVRIVVVSRAEPPVAFSRLVAHRRITRIEAQELDLEPQEAVDLARLLKVNATAAHVEPFRARAGGWVTGTMMLLEALPSGASTGPVPQALFDYFATEVLAPAPARVQRLLLETALLPDLTVAAAEALTGAPAAAEILNELARRNVFTTRLAAQEPTFRYHPLFREFLMAAARKGHRPEQWRALIRRAGDILLGQGSVSDAASLLIEAGDHGALARIVEEHAAAYVREGQVATVECWLRSLPDDVVRRRPWLDYWLGVCRSASAPADARENFRRAYRTFRADDDPRGSFTTWAGFVNTFVYVWDRFGPLDPWIAELEELLARHRRLPSVEIEAEVTSGMMASLVWRRADHPRLSTWIARAEALLQHDLAPELRMRMGTYLAFFRLWWRGDAPGAMALLDELRPLLSSPGLPPQLEVLHRAIEAAHHAQVGDHEACFAVVERGLAQAECSGVIGLGLTLAIQGIHAAMGAGDLESAVRYHRRAAAYVGPEHATNLCHLHHLAAWMSLCAGDLVGAEAEFRVHAAHAAVSQAELVHPWKLHFHATLLVERGRYDEAVVIAQEGLDWARSRQHVVMEQQFLLAQAWAFLAAGREREALDRLRPALALGREHGIATLGWTGWRSAVAGRLAALALEHGIEVEQVSAYVRGSRLAPPGSGVALQRWPWAVEVRTLGRLELRRDGERVVFPRKIQRKPLELLQALVAYGGSDVSEATLADALWPDARGDAARHALEATLHRLRKLLGAPNAVLRCDRKLSLDPATCWVDAFALEAALSRAQKVLEGPVDVVGPGVETSAITDLYRGPFLATAGDDLPWALRRRTRLRRLLWRHLSALEHRGAQAELRQVRQALAEADDEFASRDAVFGAA
jgi:ATP/maltotriose-dependent transcriptional regulator MalT